ncbi:peptidoglycan-binding protein [Oryzobacter telluris]|uniref:L,D-transpeptidase family protein n=1 Tax=Oryzobacter telluris TaxID=3149179 RepID=UPI00370DA0E4
MLATAATLLAGCGYVPQWSAGQESPVAAAPTPEPTVEPTLEPEPTVTPSETPTPTPTPTVSTPAPTPTPTPSPTTTVKPRTSLRYGDQGEKVLAVQKRLSELGYWLGTPDGSFGSLTQQAVFALQKAAGLSRDGIVGPRTKRALENGVRPRAKLSGDGVEIDLDRQLLLVVRDGRVRMALNTSTGNGEEYTSTKGNRAIATTPEGSYTVYRAVDGPLTNSLGELWRPRFFNRGIAVHGSPNIPPYAASHGCARLANAAINMIWAADLMPIGSRVLVH